MLENALASFAGRPLFHEILYNSEGILDILNLMVIMQNINYNTEK